MTNALRALCIVLLFIFAPACAKAKPVYEYRTLDKTNEPRIETTDGRNTVIKEMLDQGWELTDPSMAGRTSRMIFRREKK
jgi:hypothetical protein